MRSETARGDVAGSNADGRASRVQATPNKRIEEAVFEELPQIGRVSVFSDRPKSKDDLRFDKPIFLADRAPEPLDTPPTETSPLRAPSATRFAAPAAGAQMGAQKGAGYQAKGKGPRKTNKAQSNRADRKPRPRATPSQSTKPSWSPTARILALLAVIAVPAVAAAPEDLGKLPGDAPTEAEMVSARLQEALAKNPAMPFERPGMSFPGSAFFFLADPPEEALIALPTTDALLPETAEAGRELGAMIDAGPGATPFFSQGGTAHSRAASCLAQAVWYEAANESEAGRRAVAQVVLNRVAHPSWPNSVCGVVYQGSSRRTGCQFTFTCDGSLKRKARGRTWEAAQEIASDALGGSVYKPIGHATHYHTLWVNPYWASSLDHVGTIGAHRFYRNRGSGGRKGAFTQSYAGVEPSVAGSDRSSAGATPAIAAGADAQRDGSDFVPSLPDAPSVGAQSQGQFVNSAPGVAANSSPAAPTASLTPPSAAPVSGPGSVRDNTGVAGAGQVRQDYSRSGQWKSDAARAALQREAEERANRPPPGAAGPQ